MAVATLTERKHVFSPSAKPPGIFTSSLLLDKFAPQEKPGEETALASAKPRGALKIASKFESFLASKPGNYDPASGMASILICVNRYSKKEINEFIRMLPLYQYECAFAFYAGIFVSHLLNSSEHDNFKITLPPLEKPIDYLCFRNKKNIELFGNVGGDFGKYSEGGFILLHGNAGLELGYMQKGGTITVDGNCKAGVGEGMQGGEIHVTKDADGLVGWNMHGGTIRVNGKLNYDWKTINGGNIYWGDKIMIQDGLRVWDD